MNLSDKRILVTGGTGFLGSHVCAELRLRGMKPGLVAGAYQAVGRGFDLTSQAAATRLFAKVNPHVVIHCAAYCGGIGLNQATPAKMLHDNLLINTHVLQACVAFNVQKIVAIGSVCAYPKDAPLPFKESDVWNGYPEETNAPYGLAKRILLAQCQAYRQEFGLNAVYLLPANLYGPRDNFDLQTSHVIPALIRKVIEARQAGEKSITIWGDGSPTRDFLYVEDAARAIVDAAEKYDGCEPVNIGTGAETSIRDLADEVCTIAGFKGLGKCDPSKPNGQRQRVLDCTRAKEAIGFTSQWSLLNGLQRTIDWYEAANNIVRPGKTQAEPEPIAESVAQPVAEIPVLSSDPHPIMITVPADMLESIDE